MPAITPLAGLCVDADATYGGKAAGLARLIAAGARVPCGFAVAASSLAPESWSSAERHEFLANVDELLREGAVAVRSSAVGEDSAERSFAGLLETTLGVQTSGQALAAARRCVASGSSDLVAAYGASRALPVGLVVQRMVLARAAGVCFTVDPLGRDGALLVEAVAGAGDALVSGRKNASRFRVYRNGFGEWEVHSSGAGPDGVLTEQDVITVATEAARLQAREHRPLDLEWAIDEQGTLFWLQMRPVTSWRSPRAPRVERSAPGADDGPVTVWSNWNVRETMPDPLHPLTWGRWCDILGPMAVKQLVGVDTRQEPFRDLATLDLVQGRIYFNMCGLLGLPSLGPLSVRIMRLADARAAETVSRLQQLRILRPRRRTVSPLRLLASVLAASFRRLSIVPNLLAPRRALRALEGEARAVKARPPVHSLSDSQLAQEMFIFEDPACRNLRDGLQFETLAMALFGLASRAFRFSPQARGLLTAGIAGPTTTVSLGIERLVDSAAPLRERFLAPGTPAEVLTRLGADASGRAWLTELRRFLDEFGHRGPREFDLGVPRWSETPAMLVALVTAHLRAPREPVSARLAALRAQRKAAMSEAIRNRRIWQRPWLAWLARRLERHTPLREAPKHFGMVVFQRMREAALELGRRLAAHGILPEADDVFFMTWQELTAQTRGEPAPADLRACLDRRKAEYEDFLVHSAPDFVRSDGVPVLECLAAEHEEGLLRGVPVSAGRARGPVRPLTEPDAEQIQPGEVILMRFADPGWTPFFLRAVAVVMEVGGAMCHAAVVAREMGVPAVFGVHEAMVRLPEGTVVEVDGAAGTVRLLGTETREGTEAVSPHASEATRASG